MEANQLTSKDWIVLEHLAELLGFYEDAVRTLESDGQLRRRKRGWVGSIPDSEHLRININLGWEKLNKYYRLLGETPIYCTALALHPAFRWDYFENKWKDHPDWVVKAKQTVREGKYYNPFQAYCERTRSVSGPSIVKEELAGSGYFEGNEQTDDVIDELELW
ncbi:hypothetical protein MY3296_009337 [Beauveria thailandica]